MNLLKKSPYYVVFGAAVTVFITLGLNHSNGLFLLPITNELNSGRELFSLAGAFGILFSGIGAPFFGGLSDKYGAGRIIFILGLLQIISWIWVGNINSEFDLFGSRILMGLGQSGVLGIALSITGRSINSKNKSVFLGVIMASGSFGQFVIVPIISYFINNFGWVYSSILASVLISPLLIMSILISKNSSSQNFIDNDQTIYESLKNAINNSKNIVLDKFIFSIGIRHIGQENAKTLANYFKKSEKFSQLFNSTKRKEILKNLDDLDGIGETQIKSVEDFFSNKKNAEIIQKLINSLTIKDYEKKIKSGKLSNKNIMFTGGFKKMSRSEAKTIAEENGAKIACAGENCVFSKNSYRMGESVAKDSAKA